MHDETIVTSGGWMAEQKKEKWLSWLALTTVVFAVGATPGVLGHAVPP